MAATRKLKPAKKSGVKKTAGKKIVSPQEKEQRRQKACIRALFARMGFDRVKSDGIEFVFKGRTGEVDDVFVIDNIVIVAEYTVGAPSTTHISKKSILFKNIEDSPAEWVAYARSIYPDLDLLCKSSDYLPEDYKIRICYFSTRPVSEEMGAAYPSIYFLNGTTFRYFDALSKTIHRSARHEFYKYLGLKFKEIGAEIKNSGSQAKVFRGHVLPEGFSNFPKGFKVVSFYADPNALLTLSYVLRRDSWRDEEGMYQRVLQRSRMGQMRKYLTSEKRVFVNNIIVTLPNETKLNDPADSGKNIDPTKITTVQDVNVVVPLQSNSIGLVDGQHRVFCYHEGTDKHETQIKALRQRQNLLVTGVVFPPGYEEAAKRRFEAKLFLEINDKQKRTKSELRQSIELILSPYSAIAIAKAVVQKLNGSGALKDLLQTNYFDPPNLIRTTSIVSYGLKPLLKLEGADSLFSVWADTNKSRLKDLQQGAAPNEGSEDLLNRYTEFCADKINDLLIAAKMTDPDRWKISDTPKIKLLTPTIVNGFFVCLRLMVEGGKLSTRSTYENRLAALREFQYSKYKSSHWRALGEALYSFL